MKAAALAATLGMGGLLVVAAVFDAAGLCINTSDSIPPGLYVATAGAVTKDSYVLFCPPERPIFDDAKRRGYISAGFCTGGYGRMMKKVLAAKGDVVSVTPQAVFVNGVALPHSTPLERDQAGRALPLASMNNVRLATNQLLLMTDRSAKSFDARYFGLIDTAQIHALIRPVFTW